MADSGLLEIVNNDRVLDSTFVANAVLDKVDLISLGPKRTKTDIERALCALNSTDWRRAL